MADTILCPMCQSPVVLDDTRARALCTDCHDLTEQELFEELQKRVDRALWQAVRAVDDQAAYARWAAAQGKPAPPSAAGTEQAADLLRSLLSSGRRRPE